MSDRLQHTISVTVCDVTVIDYSRNKFLLTLAGFKSWKPSLMFILWTEPLLCASNMNVFITFKLVTALISVRILDPDSEPDSEPTCQTSSQPDGAGMRTRRALRRQQPTEDGVRDEVERVPRHVPQDHGAGPPVQALDALGLQDAADAVDGPPVELLVGDGDGAQGDVGAARHVSGKAQGL